MGRSLTYKAGCGTDREVSERVEADVPYMRRIGDGVHVPPVRSENVADSARLQHAMDIVDERDQLADVFDHVN